MHKIITISRQTGSGGTEIGRILAEQLNIPFYDKTLLKGYAVENGLGKAMMDSYGEKHASSLLFSLSTSAFSFGYYNAAQDSTIGQKAYLTAFETIKEVARSGPCVIVGRCADYILRNNPQCVHFFIHAPLETRVRTVSERCGIDTGEARRQIQEQDLLRCNYYNYYTCKRWGEMDSYHFSVDSSLLGTESTAALLEKILRMDCPDFADTSSSVIRARFAR